MNQNSLTQDGIVLLSGGFEGPFFLQAFSIKKISPPHSGLELCLTDGKVYIGGRYNGGDYPEIQAYWILEITAKCVSQTQPISIKSMKVISTFPRKLIGSNHCTLVDYFMRETNQKYQERQERIDEPTKKVKYSSDAPAVLRKSDTKKPAQKQKPTSTWFPVGQNFQIKSQSPPQPQQKTQVQLQAPVAKLKVQKKEVIKKLKISESDNEDGSQQQKQSTVQKIENNKQVKIGQKMKVQISSLKNCYISDLDEQKTGWSILCKVNCLNIIECSNGVYASNFMAVDENGDEIKCVYFDNPNQRGQSIQLQSGGYYTFSGGQIKKILNKITNNSVGKLQITFDKSSFIILRNNVEFNQNVNICKIGGITQKLEKSDVNVIGLVKQTKYVSQQSKTKLKYHVVICDPVELVEIELPLFLGSNIEPPKRGDICVFHNYTVHHNSNSCKLNSNYKSYVKEVTDFKDNLSLGIKKAKQEMNWQQKNYKNISSAPFVVRNILELKNMTYNKDDQKCYSLVDCYIFECCKKNYYHACKNCRKATEKLDKNVFYCSQCKKNVDTFSCHTFSLILSDFTASISVDIIGEHAETLLEMKSSSFEQLSQAKQKVHLNEIKMSNIVVRLKSERKDSSSKRETHSIWGIEHFSLPNALQKIKAVLQNK